MAQSTDPQTVAARKSLLDDIQGRGALAKLAPFDDRKLSTLSGKDLVKVCEAVYDLIGPVSRERDRRKQTPRGKARLRLVAEDGELTRAGDRHVRALKGHATRRANRSVA